MEVPRSSSQEEQWGCPIFEEISGTGGGGAAIGGSSLAAMSPARTGKEETNLEEGRTNGQYL